MKPGNSWHKVRIVLNPAGYISWKIKEHAVQIFVAINKRLPKNKEAFLWLKIIIKKRFV